MMVARDFLTFLNMLTLVQPRIELVLLDSRCWLRRSLKLCSSAEIRGWLMTVWPSSVSRFSLERCRKLLLSSCLIDFLL